MKKKFFFFILLVILIVSGIYVYNSFVKGFLVGYGPSETPENSLNIIELPEGFKIEYYVENINNARSLALGPQNTVFVGTRTVGNVYAVIDENQDYKADNIITIASGLNTPNGVAYKDGDLYVTEINRILKFENIMDNLENAEYEVLFDDYPEDTHHGWKYIAFGPDGNLYVPVGAPCNICEPGDPYAAITKLNKNFTDYEIIAQGVRNTVGFDWHPETERLWFTDNGRDWLGENQPKDELNKITETGQHFGYPYCHDYNIQDPEFGQDVNCDTYVKPEQELGPHVAALGMNFYTGEMFPEQYKNQIFIAEHGSWNRKVPIGYRVSLVRLNNNNEAVSYETFAEGWLQQGKSWGRPVDILEMPDGSLLVSDDKGDSIYRIYYETS